MKNVPERTRETPPQSAQTPAETSPAAHGRAADGSTIISVLIALVFIGIVTASLLRNTGSQAGASVGYGTMQTMAVTAKSGIVATESFFNANVGGAALAAVNRALAGNDSFALGGNKQKLEIAKGQNFSSKIISYDAQNSRTAAFEIKSGTSANGRDFKKALAFYNVENGRITGETQFPGSNAFSATGNARMFAGNAGTRFVGHVTIENGLLTQNGGPVEFLPDENGEGSVYVSGASTINNNSSQVRFEVPAYFDDNVTIQNVTNDALAGNSVFRKDVGFNGNISASNKTIGFDGDVWFNGNFSSDNNSVLKSNNPNNKFYYTNKIPMSTNAMCGMCPATSCPHNCTGHSVTQSLRITDFVNMHPDSTSGYRGDNIDDIPDKLNMKPIGERGEPDLNIKNVTEKDGKEFRDIFNMTPPGSWNYDVLDAGGNLNGAKLQAFYDRTHNDPDYARFYDNGHLLLTIPANRDVSTAGGEFNGKVVFNIEGSLNSGSGKFYTSDPDNPDASTLIYVGQRGKLNDFGVGADGNFSGLIYVDPSNTSTNTFSWGNNTTLNGAVILKGGLMTWNNSNNSVTTIRRDQNVLRNYGFLLDDADLDNVQVELIDQSKGLIFSRAGYYFY